MLALYPLVMTEHFSIVELDIVQQCSPNEEISIESEISSMKRDKQSNLNGAKRLECKHFNLLVKKYGSFELETST